MKATLMTLLLFVSSMSLLGQEDKAKPYYCGQTYDTPTISINKIKTCDSVYILKGDEKIAVTKFIMKIPSVKSKTGYKDLVADSGKFTDAMIKEVNDMKVGDQLMLFGITSTKPLGGLSFKIVN
tara:strand:+ start:539 stop:910 length:372 start_codon:yes stop_codon:yes gene_type:complete